MNVEDIITDKRLTAIARVLAVAASLLARKSTANELVSYAQSSKDTVKSICLEALEFASREKPEIVNRSVFDFAVQSLKSDAPAVKRESARVIANTAHLYPRDLSPALPALLENAVHPGTVVRWSAATALAALIEIKCVEQKKAILAAQKLLEHEEKGSIQRIYSKALKRIAVKGL